MTPPAGSFGRAIRDAAGAAIEHLGPGASRRGRPDPTLAPAWKAWERADFSTAAARAEGPQARVRAPRPGGPHSRASGADLSAGEARDPASAWGL